MMHFAESAGGARPAGARAAAADAAHGRGPRAAQRRHRQRRDADRPGNRSLPSSPQLDSQKQYPPTTSVPMKSRGQRR